MAKARALDRRRKAIRNIRKITRTMELIATAKFKKALDRASAATAYTKRVTALVADLAKSGLEVSHPLLEPRSEVNNAVLLVLTGNRGLCGGYNGNVQRLAMHRLVEMRESVPKVRLEISGKRGLSGFKFRGIVPEQSYLHFEDKPTFEEVEVLANRFLADYIAGRIDRLDVAYTRFINVSRQEAIVETLLPLESLAGADSEAGAASHSLYEFMPSAQSILEEVVPTSFKIKLFKVFLDAAVSEQIARMVSMKRATENADEMIGMLSRTYNRARQGQITSEILDVVGGVEALKG